jgi:hypothetical protein
MATKRERFTEIPVEEVRQGDKVRFKSGTKTLVSPVLGSFSRGDLTFFTVRKELKMHTVAARDVLTGLRSTSRRKAIQKKRGEELKVRKKILKILKDSQG